MFKSGRRYYGDRPGYILYTRGFRISTNTQSDGLGARSLESSDFRVHNFSSVFFFQQSLNTNVGQNDYTTKFYKRDTVDTQ